MGLTLNDYLFDSSSALVLHGNKSLTDEDLGQLLNLGNDQRRKITTVVLSHTNITGESIRHLGLLENLKRLYLRETCIAEDAPFDMLPKTIELVNLDGTRATDLSIGKLIRLPRLNALSLRRTRVTDGAVHQLVNAGSLREVCLAETAVSDQAKQRLDNRLLLDAIRFSVALRYIQFSIGMALRALVLRMRPDPRRYL